MQSTPMHSIKAITTNTALNETNISAKYAKAVLDKALKNQPKSAYNYKTSVVISNQNRINALDKATPLQLAMADDKESYCDVTHDNAYITLSHHAISQGNDIEDVIYSDQRDAIKQQNINCMNDYKIWQAAQDQDTNYTLDYDDVLDDDEALSIAALVLDDMKDDSISYIDEAVDIDSEYASQQDSELNIERFGESDTTERREAYLNQDYLPNYDGDHTQLDFKRAKLLNAYLLKPLSIEYQGVYRPYSGFMTLLPSIQYQTRNHTTAINQPVYIDAKNGNVYIWADNFGYLFARVFDENLGNGWRNKWLKFDVEDGSLPSGFGKDLIKMHMKAMNSANAETDEQLYQAVRMDSIDKLSPKMMDEQLAILKPLSATDQIISRHFNQQDSDTYDVDYYRTFYNEMTLKYPQLNPDSNDSNDDIDNKFIMTKVLVFMKRKIDHFESTQSAVDNAGNQEDSNLYASELDNSDSNTNRYDLNISNPTQSPFVNYAQYPTGLFEDYPSLNDEINKTHANQANPVSIAPLIEYYGLDKSDKIIWRLQRYQMSDFIDSDFYKEHETGEGAIIDKLTHYSKGTNTKGYFPNLPANVQTPNALNSISVKEYKQALMESYENGEGSEIGGLILMTVPMIKGLIKLSY